MSIPYFIDWIEQDCTKCSSFSDIWLRSDSGIVMPQSQEIKVTCKVHGLVKNKLLYVCDKFIYDASKPELVYQEKRAGFRFKRFFVRIGSLDEYFKKDYQKTDLKSNVDPLIRSIYDLVCKVYQEHGLKSWLKFVVSRIHLDTGISKETVFRCVMDMVESGYLSKGQFMGQICLSPPPVVMSISDVRELGKKKVMA